MVHFDKKNNLLFMDSKVEWPDQKPSNKEFNP